jgi:hypothetical protein
LVINIVTMGTNVSGSTIAIKKRQHIAFRRFMTGKAPSLKMREYVGLNYLELKEWINSRMLPGMNWNNYGDYWVISHVVPLSLFDLSKEEDCKLAWSYFNLIPILEGDIYRMTGQFRFFIVYLKALEKSPIVDRLIDIVSSEINLQDEYYKAYINGKYYESV